MIKRLFLPLISALFQISIILIGIGWVLDSGAEAMNYTWQWSRIPPFIAVFEDGRWWATELSLGLWVTIKLSIASFVGTLAIGLTTALLRTSHSIIGKGLAWCYIELIRNTPLLVQVYILYFILGPTLGFERFTTAILALSLFQGAYTAEVIRAGLNSIDNGQREAALSLGLSNIDTYRYILLPQMIQRVLPPLTNEAVSLIKNSSIVSVMAIFDLTTEARNLVSETAMPFEIWFVVAVLYLILTLSLSMVAARLEHRFGIN
ncbi:amino acid ABC transporter permease [Thaumasiovibrio sp. DFM-14]|uniref:amino acid ABC transporter permease n=1 Tax=Thaumasiovibrio sp. DFM-14 TaxID=3384792 RepID=UPI0039A34CE1